MLELILPLQFDSLSAYKTYGAAPKRLLSYISDMVPPFLTAMKNPEDIPEMLHEMSTVGVSMAAIVTVVWAIAEVASYFIKTKSQKPQLKGAF